MLNIDPRQLELFMQNNNMGIPINCVLDQVLLPLYLEIKQR